jgi:hypothetical protein
MGPSGQPERSDVVGVATAQQVEQADVKCAAQLDEVVGSDSAASGFQVADVRGAPSQPFGEVGLAPATSGAFGAHVGCDVVADARHAGMIGRLCLAIDRLNEWGPELYVDS